MHLWKMSNIVFIEIFGVFNTQNNTYASIIIYIRPRLYIMSEMFNDGEISNNLLFKMVWWLTTLLRGAILCLVEIEMHEVRIAPFLFLKVSQLKWWRLKTW